GKANLLLLDPISNGVGRIRLISQVVIPTSKCNNEVEYMLELFFQIKKIVLQMDEIFYEIERYAKQQQKILSCVITQENEISREEFLSSIITQTPMTPEKSRSR
ncbi:11733_t:CDS:2, partial [Cetraspora pellucida]